MKKLLFLLLVFVPFWGFSQFEAGDFIDADTAKVKGESLIYPAPATGENYYKNMRDPSEPTDGVNLRTLLDRLAMLDSLGLLVSDMVSGDTTVNEGETQIYFPSQFDTGTVVVVPYVRRVSDNAVIDYSINDVDSMGFDIVVWEDNIKVSYIASNRATNNFSMLTAYVNDSSYIKQAIRAYLRDSSILVKSPIAGVVGSVPHYTSANKIDSSLVYIYKDRLGIGINTPIGSLHTVSRTAYPIVSDMHVGGAGGNGIMFRSSRGTPESPTKTRANDILGSLLARGYAEDVPGFSTGNRCAIVMYAAEDYTSTAQGTYIVIGTTPIGSLTRSERLRIMDNGNVGFGTTAPDRKLEINSMTGSNLRLSYNDANGSAANYMDLTTESSGNGVINVASGDTVKLGGATNYTGIEPDGTIVFRGNSTVWDDVNTGVAAAKLPAANYPAWTAFTANTNAYTFAVNDYADLSTIEIPHGYKEGSNLEVHCHIATNGTNNATARKVQYLVYYTYCVPDNGSYQFSAEASLKAELTIPANQPDKSGYYISLGTITGTNIKIGTQVKLRFKRIASTGTEPINDPFVGQVAIHYEKDTEGSRTISTK